ncbi:MAG: HD domain-containing protein, partial [Sediminibacterium sp.]
MFHIESVWRYAKLIAASEPVDLLVTELAALLHDIADSKFHHGDEEIGPA